MITSRSFKPKELYYDLLTSKAVDEWVSRKVYTKQNILTEGRRVLNYGIRSTIIQYDLSLSILRQAVLEEVGYNPSYQQLVESYFNIFTKLLDQGIDSDKDWIQRQVNKVKILAPQILSGINPLTTKDEVRKLFFNQLIKHRLKSKPLKPKMLVSLLEERFTGLELWIVRSYIFNLPEDGKAEISPISYSIDGDGTISIQIDDVGIIYWLLYLISESFYYTDNRVRPHLYSYPTKACKEYVDTIRCLKYIVVPYPETNQMPSMRLLISRISPFEKKSPSFFSTYERCLHKAYKLMGRKISSKSRELEDKF